MISLKKRNQGFTIVELLIVIVVIGILALLVITTYSGIQAKARNSKRSSDVSTIQTQLEAYFQDQGHYPSLKDMNQTATSDWLSKNMKSLDTGALIDPSNSDHSILLNSSADGVKNQYSYAPTKDDGTSDCETDDTLCTKYTLTATYEGKVNGADNTQKHNLD